MDIIEDYWRHIAQRLIAEHSEKKVPADWTKSEAESFLRKLQTKTGKSISATTFRRIFKEGHLGKLETKDIFAQYFDYPTHGDYIKEELHKKRTSPIFFLVPLLAIILFGVVFWNQSEDIPQTTPSSDTTSSIEKLVKQAIDYQYDAFKAIPNYNGHLDTLRMYYQADGSAFKEIFAILERQSELNWTISNSLNASMAELLNIRVDSIKGNKAFASTTEHWRLDWFSNTSQRYEYQYEVTNDQTYLLDFDESTQQWKILQNSFSGDKFRYIPKYIDCDSILEQTINIATTNKYAKLAIENDGLDLALKVMECFYSKNTTQPFPSELSLLLSKKTKLLREVNTNVIDKETFEIRKIKLFEEILEFLE